MTLLSSQEEKLDRELGGKSNMRMKRTIVVSRLS